MQDTSVRGCNPEAEAAQRMLDDPSIPPDECWQESYKGDSRKWLIRDGSRKLPGNMICSTMKETYAYPNVVERQTVGKRRELLMKELYEQATQEIIEENNEPPPVEEYCTEYDGNYSITGFDPARCGGDQNTVIDFTSNQELYDKYPLYASAPMSYWNFRAEYSSREQPIPGLSEIADFKNKFKKSAGFTKPISEVLDQSCL